MLTKCSFPDIASVRPWNDEYIKCLLTLYRRRAHSQMFRGQLHEIWPSTEHESKISALKFEFQKS